ncbi:hypothetical protein WQ59_13120 [Streptomyces sp. KE1]|nr:hypothetical protein WQ59_13120 [Streptomyces sp. KE1]
MARLAGVSQATVSLVLGARKQSVAVSEETERHAPADELLRLVADGFPVVHLGRRDELEGLAWVGADYISASRTVVARLAALGIGWA